MNLQESFRICMEEMPKDLRACSYDIQWCFYEGYQQTARKERTSGIITGPDQVKGPKFDFGIGNHKAREAFHTACRLLKATEVRLAGALALSYFSDQPKLATVKEPIRMIGSCLVRLALLDTKSELLRQESLDQVVKAYGSAWKCRCTLQTALQTPVKELKPDIEVLPCSICEIRLASQKAAGNRCDTCYQYLRRKGKERPKALDKGKPSFYEEALAAQKKRHAIGAGFGAS